MSGDAENEALLDLAARVLARVDRGDAEVAVADTDFALTRFASNAIHQNVASRTRTVRLRLQAGGREGVASANGVVAEDVDALVSAAAAARDVAPVTDVTPLPAGDASTGAAAFSEATANASPELRATMVRDVVSAAERAGVLAYGALDTATRRFAVVNTAGVRRAYSRTDSGCVTVMRGENGAGYADRFAVDVGALDAAAIGAEAAERCALNQNAEAVPPGEYEVVLAPYAVAAMLSHLSAMGFSGLAVAEGRSFMRPGERLMSETVSIYDDPTASGIAATPFDAEGVPSQRVELIRNGVCAGILHDSASARRAGVASTGHALPMPNTQGAWGTRLAMEPGTASLEELIGNVRDGLFVTRFWYVRDVHPLRTSITGMTREGTFRIRDGRLAGAVKDLRFTQSIVDALADVRGIGRDAVATITEWDTPARVPALHLGHFTFSS